MIFNMSKIKREINELVEELSTQYPVLSITGPRQSGKTTLCKALFKSMKYVNLEDLDEREFAQNDPKGFLAQFPEGAILDEIQRAPDLTSYIQGIVDQEKFKGLFILTGSQNFSILNTLSQSLAGRVALITLLPFSFSEISHYCEIKDLNDLIYRGFYPRIPDKNQNPSLAYSSYVSTFVERDIRQLELIKNIDLFQKFLKLLAGRIGQVINLESLGNDTGISGPTVREWISLLEASYIVYKLPPFYENIGKRLIKSPKIYFYDVGLASYLIGIDSPEQINTHPLRGFLFENLVISEILKQRFNQGKKNDLLFYRDHNNVEVDLLIPRVNNYDAYEIKSAQTISKSFFSGLKKFEKSSSKLADAYVIYSGTNQRVQEGIKILPYFDLKSWKQ